MTVHSTQLAAATGKTAGTYTVYTVPAGKRTILKTIGVINGAAATQWIVVTITDGSGNIFFFALYPTASAAAGDFQQLQTWQVLNAGDVIKVTVAANSASYMLSGAELTV